MDDGPFAQWVRPFLPCLPGRCQRLPDEGATGMRRPSLAVLGLAAAAVAAAPAASAFRPTPFSLAVARADGVILPFAHFDGKWKQEWPFPPKKVEVPIGIADVPKGWWPDGTPELAWNLWTFDGDARRIEVTEPFLTPLYCGAVVGLRTSYGPAGPPPPLSDQPYPKIGLATTGDVVVEPITVVEEGSDDWRRLEARLVEPFDQAEGEAIGREWAFGWGFPVRSEDRAGKPVTLEAVYRAPHETPGSVAYFIEASRRYETSRWSQDEPCDLVTFAWGWAIGEPGGGLTLKVDAYITDCRRGGVNVMYPLGLLRLDGRVVWVAQWSGWEEETYAVVEVPRDLDTKTLSQTRAGRCW